MSDDQQEQLNRIETKLDRLSVLILGSEGQGGLHRWVHDLDTKVDTIRMSQQLDRGKTIGMSIAVSVIISIVGLAIRFFSK